MELRLNVISYQFFLYLGLPVVKRRPSPHIMSLNMEIKATPTKLFDECHKNTCNNLKSNDILQSCDEFCFYFPLFQKIIQILIREF